MYILSAELAPGTDRVLRCRFYNATDERVIVSTSTHVDLFYESESGVAKVRSGDTDEMQYSLFDVTPVMPQCAYEFPVRLTPDEVNRVMGRKVTVTMHPLRVGNFSTAIKNEVVQVEKQLLSVELSSSPVVFTK